MAERALDQRHHVTLVDDRFREKLARVKPEIIPAYVSWAMRNQMYRRYGALAAQRSEEAKKTGDVTLEQRMRAYAVKFEKAVEYLDAAWARNLDMSIAENGLGRRELVQTIQHETGRVLPSEAGKAQTINIHGGNGSQAKKPGLLAALKPK